ncbi:MAG: ATP-binding protein [Candidatus Aminicenantes bacterium]|nr:ATP-binding protein [Candidatus Aminicenantes bacterium]
MKIMKGIRILFVLVALSSGLFAQSFLVRTFEENDGLINSAVNDIAQDFAGRMWFCTRNGISVYDGATWSSFTTTNGLSTQAVTQIQIDTRGSMWTIGMYPTWPLTRFDGKAWTSFPFPQVDVPLYNCTGLAVRSESRGIRVAVGTTKSGVFIFDGVRWKVVSKTQGLAGNTVRDIAVFEDGFLAATNEGLSWVGENSVENRWEKTDPLLHEDIRGVTVETAPDGDKIWVVGSTWLGAVQGGRFEVVIRENPLRFTETSQTAKLLPDRKGGLFYGNTTGVYYYDRTSGSSRPLGIREGLIAEGTTSLLLDRESNIWIGGLRGVSRISSRRFFNYRRAQGLLEDEVTAIQTFGDGAVAFAHNLGLSVWNGTEFRHIVLDRKPNIADGEIRILDLAADDDGGLWLAAAAQGLGRLGRDSRLRWYDFPDGRTEPVTSVVFDQNRRLWIARNNSLFQLQNGRPVEVFPGQFRGGYIRKIVASRGGLIFVATGNRGLFRWDGNAWAHFSDETDSGAANVYSVYVDSNGRTLVGTFSGLRQIAGDRLNPFSENGFEIRRPVFLILEDKAGRLWFGTDNGVIRWDGKTRRDFSKAEGLSGREINRSAGMIDALGRVWIGTNNGVSCYRENFDLGPDDVPPPMLSLTGLDINGKATDPSKELVLGYRENNIVFYFLGTSFIDENALRFESFLDGFEKTWGPEYTAADRRIRYTNLPPGTYVFNIRAKNALGTRSDPIFSPVIRIRNPFWLQWWFILAALLLGGGLILSVGLAVTQHRQAERLEALVLDRTAQIQASLREKEILLKEVHHRVKNNLQIISSLLFLQSRRITDPGLLALFQGTISRVRAMALVHESLYQSDLLTSIVMEDYLRKLVHHLLEIYDIRKEPVVADIRAAGISLPLETAITYGLIVNELVSNALKHAFPDNRKGVIKITLARTALDAAGEPAQKREIILTVSDNGVGIPEEMKKGKPESLGLRLTQNLASQLDGTIDVRSDSGTVFRIVFPE